MASHLVFRPLALTVLLTAACSSPSPPGADGGVTDAPSDARDAADVATDRTDPPGFTDHTVGRLDTRADFDAVATVAHGFESTKLVITSFQQPTRRDVRFYDGRTYTLHDEWYWFRLLNGAWVPGDDGVMPVQGMTFPTVQSIYAWALRQSALPLDLQIADGRLYSWRFYDLSFGRTRARGLATLLHLDARTTPTATPERWAFELEYSDALTHPELVVFFDEIKGHLSSTLGRDLYWVVRSAEQETLAQQMERERLPYWDHILRYRDLVTPGAREVYSDGIAAGSLRFIRAGDRTDNTTNEDILVFDHVPDLLPQAAGVLTAVPQTPLAHINLLARNRGIPNAHIAGVMDDPEIEQLARGWARVVYYAASPSTAVLAAITAEQYDRYRALATVPARTVTTPPTASMPYVVDLTARTVEERASLIPMLGGKSTGLIALVRDEAVVRPDRPQGITVRAYVEHLAPLRTRIEAALRAPRFELDARVREVVLQGVTTFRAQHADAASLAFLDALMVEHPSTTDLGALIRAGGVRGLVEATPINPTTLADITRTLRDVWSDLAVTQGIRFRSSSNVEDVEGFNGAGLYESYTGFLDAASQPRASDRDKTVERAIQRVWGSFWGFEAFEERRAERIDHLSPAMALLVHPRFDDPLERATGVCTFTLLPPNSADDARLEVNVQARDLSVANPDPRVLPEVVRVSRARGSSTLRIERVRRSTESPDADLLDEAALRRLFDDTARVTTAWLAVENRTRPAAQRGRTLTLDFEFHDMLAGWPAMRDGTVRPARLVLKQARSLEPGSRIALPEASSWPLPRDVFVRARRVSVDTCSADLAGGTSLRVTALRALTDTSLPPDVGAGEVPFEASLTVSTTGAAWAAMGWSAGATYALDHTAFTATREGARTRWTVSPAAPAATNLGALVMGSDGRATFTRGATSVDVSLTCVTELRYASPRDYLLSLLPATR